MNLFLGFLYDTFIAGRGEGGTGGAGATPFADESDSASAYAAKKQNAARDAFAKIPTKAEVARNILLDSHWSVWGSGYGGAPPPMVTRRWARTAPPRGRSVLLPAPTIGF